ncbi:hypothetical protein SJAG_01451 [Schizosaccharomyces japonicus yFS275]|uniref:Uncharacterized protein n=1 Tax=Schizosaccharomyces japonicus (strain yFS275 / FY16936) TaxID=402676 RepID=B6JXZ1_SCHJY|nr:hypothetical protein SJAG_01451 [Schizosaccharomyces japonicus yFS275]EEB06409.2 hypothetical protein SJAG_01451 [Schizosaccharomyces japonicus yFS275]
MSRTTGSLTISQSLFDDVKKHYDELVKLNNWVDTIPPVTQMSTYEQLIVRTYRLLLIFIHGSVLDSLDYITEEMIFILRNSFESLLQNVDWGPVCTKMILILCSVAESSNSEKTLLALLTINLESLKYSFYDEITRKKLVDTSIVIKRKLALAYQSLLPNVSTPNHPKTLSSSSKPAPPTSQNGVAPLLEELSGEPEVSTKCMKKPVSQSPILSSVYIPKSNYIPFVRKHELHYLLEIPFDISKEDMLLLKQR